MSYIKRGGQVHTVSKRKESHSGFDHAAKAVVEARREAMRNNGELLTVEEFNLKRRAEEEAERIRLQQIKREAEEHEREIRRIDAERRKQEQVRKD